MTMLEAAVAAPLDEQMLVTDVVDTLRHGIDVPLDAEATDGHAAVVESLAEIYHGLGIEPPEPVLRDGIAAVLDGRFSYAPPRGPAAVLARLYVRRASWGPAALALALVLAIGLGAYFFAYRPYQQSRAMAAEAELRQDLPAQMDALYQQIFNETKVQTAASDAGELRDRGKEAATGGDRAAAEQAIAELTALRDQLGESYSVKVVDQDGVKPGFWTFPPNNSEATNYYLVVEATDADGKVLSLPVTSEDTGKTQTVARWGLRVPQTVYDAVVADKADDGIIEHNLIGIKQDGFIDLDYAVPVLGGSLTQW